MSVYAKEAREENLVVSKQRCGLGWNIMIA